MLIYKINQKFSNGVKTWIASNKYSEKEASVCSNCIPTTSWVTYLKNHSIGGEIYSTYCVNEHNCTVSLKDNSKASYGRIESIFEHSRTGMNDEVSQDVFFIIKPLMAIPPIASNPFRQLSDYEMQVSLRMLVSETSDMIVHESEIHSHCSWIKFKPGEICDQIDFETIAVVLIDRS
jgi:hypothetical protein